MHKKIKNRTLPTLDYALGLHPLSKKEFVCHPFPTQTFKPSKVPGSKPHSKTVACLIPSTRTAPPGAITTISGDHFEVKTVSGEVLLAGRFFLDSSTVPKGITWVDSIGDDAGKHLPASYRLEGDEFVFIAADESMPRPIVFSTGPGQTMRTFVRRS